MATDAVGAAGEPADTDAAGPGPQDVTQEAADPTAGEGSAGKEDVKQKELDKGKDEYNAGNYEAAVKAWARSLQSVKYIFDKGLYDKKPEQLQEVRDMELKLNVNMAQGHLKTGEYCKAIEYADKALARDPQNTKALYRKASAHMQLLSFEEAGEALEQLLQVEPGNAAAKTMLAEARRNAQVSAKKAKKMSQRIFSSFSAERDPRVPPTDREVWTESVRSAPREAIRLVKDLQRQAQEMLSDVLLRLRQIWRRLGVPLRQRLQALLAAANAGKHKSS